MPSPRGSSGFPSSRYTTFDPTSTFTSEWHFVPSLKVLLQFCVVDVFVAVKRSRDGRVDPRDVQDHGRVCWHRLPLDANCQVELTLATVNSPRERQCRYSPQHLDASSWWKWRDEYTTPALPAALRRMKTLTPSACIRSGAGMSERLSYVTLPRLCWHYFTA